MRSVSNVQSSISVWMVAGLTIGGLCNQRLYCVLVVCSACLLIAGYTPPLRWNANVDPDWTAAQLGWTAGLLGWTWAITRLSWAAGLLGWTWAITRLSWAAGLLGC